MRPASPTNLPRPPKHGRWKRSPAFLSRYPRLSFGWHKQYINCASCDSPVSFRRSCASPAWGLSRGDTCHFIIASSLSLRFSPSLVNHPRIIIAEFVRSVISHQGATCFRKLSIIFIFAAFRFWICFSRTSWTRERGEYTFARTNGARSCVRSTLRVVFGDRTFRVMSDRTISQSRGRVLFTDRRI